MKTCIACSEEIQDGAKLCRFCSTRQDDDTFSTPHAPKRKTTLLEGVCNFIRKEQHSESCPDESIICNDVFEVAKLINEVLQRNPERVMVNYVCSPRPKEGLFFKALGAAKDRGQNVHIGSVFGFGYYFCDGRFWQMDTPGASISTWERMESMLFIPHGRPYYAAAIIVNNELTFAKSLLTSALLPSAKPHENDEDISLISDIISEMETFMLTMKVAIPEIDLAIKNDALQRSFLNTTWRGDLKRYKPFPWP